MAGLLKITPSTIEFPLVLNQSISTTLSLENVSSSPVAFKIKTTAPKNYLVRPSTGVIPQGKQQNVQIILQPLQAAPPAPSADRFLVQATAASDDSVNPSREFWASVPKGEVSDQRLNVSFKDDDAANRGTEEPYSGTDFARSVMQAAAATASTSRVAAMSTQIPSDPKELTAKHEELLKMCMELEADKMEMQKDMDNLRQRLAQALQSRGQEGDAPAPKGGMLPLGFEIWHAIPVIVVAIIVLKLLGYF